MKIEGNSYSRHFKAWENGPSKDLVHKRYYHLSIDIYERFQIKFES